MLESTLQQYERVGSHVGVKQCAVAVVSFTAVQHQSIAHRSQRFYCSWEKLREQDLCANIPPLSVGALAPLDHLGSGELIVEEISLVVVRVGNDRRFSNEVLHFRLDRWEPWSVLEIGCPNPVDLDGLGVDRPIRVDPGALRLALAPAIAFAQHFDETDLDDDAKGSPGKRLLTNEFGVGYTLASRLRIEGDEPVETVEEIRQVHQGAPKQRQFVRFSLIGVMTSSTTGRIAVLAASSTYDQSFEHIYRIALALLLRLSEGTPRKNGTAARGVTPGISRLWWARSEPLAHEVELTPQGSIAAGTGTPG